MLDKNLQIMKVFKMNPKIIEAAEKIPFHFSGNIYTMPEKLGKLNDYERFAYSVLSLNDLFKKYQTLNIEEKILYDTFPDFEYRILKYYQKTGRWGLFESDLKWLGLLFRAEIFKIGSLRFQKFPLDYAEIERAGHDYMPLSSEMKKRFPEKTPMINVHIQTNTDLSPQAVKDSFIKAATFFQTHFPEFKAQYFITRTWLIHESVEKLLPEESNIVQFSRQFEIIASCQNYHQPLERIYGTDDLKKITTMSKESRLEKKAWKKIDILGVSAGVLPLESVIK